MGTCFFVSSGEGVVSSYSSSSRPGCWLLVMVMVMVMLFVCSGVAFQGGRRGCGGVVIRDSRFSRCRDR